MCFSTSNSDYAYDLEQKQSDWLSQTGNDLTVFEKKKKLYKTRRSSLVQIQTLLNGEGLLRAKREKKGEKKAKNYIRYELEDTKMTLKIYQSQPWKGCCRLRPDEKVGGYVAGEPNKPG